MITINKQHEPAEFTRFKRKHPNITYKKRKVQSIKPVLRKALLEEQGYVCCYCGLRIGSYDSSGNFTDLQPSETATGEHGNIEHVISQHSAPNRSMDYSNMCFSCLAEFNKKWDDFVHCDRHKDRFAIPIIPLQPDCLSNFTFSALGKIAPSSTANEIDVDETIRVLNLNAGRLVDRRRIFIETVEELLETVSRADLKLRYSARDANGAYSELYFVALAIL